jgi:putative transposase
LQPATGTNPDHVVIDETVIQANNQLYRLYAAVDTETNEFLRMKLTLKDVSMW